MAIKHLALPFRSIVDPQLNIFILKDREKKKDLTVIYPSFSVKRAVCTASSSSISSVYLMERGTQLTSYSSYNLFSK